MQNFKFCSKSIFEEDYIGIINEQAVEVEEEKEQNPGIIFVGSTLITSNDERQAI